MAEKGKMDAAEAQCRSQVDVKSFLMDMKGKFTLTSEEENATKARLSVIKLDDPETQKVLEPLLEIAVQADIWESKNELKATWIKGRFMQVAENIFGYRRVQGGVTGGIRGILKALDWGKSPAYRAKVLVETFEDDLLEMPIGISAAKLLALIEKQKQEKKNGKTFDPIVWLDEHKDALRDATSCDAVKEMLGMVTEKKSPRPEPVETQVEPDPNVEEITVANISAKVKRNEETGLTDVVMKSLSDTQLESWKRWFNAQDFLDDDAESVPTGDTFGADPVQPDSKEDEVPATFKYLSDKVTAVTGQHWAGENPPWTIFNTFGWTNDLVDAAIDHWDEMELEEKKPQLPDMDFILEYSADVVKAAQKIILENASKTTDGEKTPDQCPVWEEVVKGIVKDDGNIDLSSLYGGKNGKTGYVVPTYEDLTTTAEPIRILENAEFTFTSQEWLDIATPLFAAQPDCIGLTMFDESGKFVVESKNNNGGSLETYWVKPACAGATANAQA